MKRKTVLIVIAAVILCAGAVAGVMKIMRGGGKAVDVTQISYLNNDWWGNTMSSGGYVTANASQEVYLSSDSIVDKVHVKVGDEVKIGDVLLDYDKTLLELTLEEEKLEGQILELELKGAKSDLERLKGITPIPDSEGETYTPVPDDLEDPGHDDWEDDNDDDDEAAVVIPNRQALVTTAAEGTAGDSGEAADPEGGTQPGDGGGTGTDPSAPDESENTAPQEPATPPTETPETQETATPPVDNGEGKDEIEESPLAKTKAYKKLNHKTKYYKGSGTKEDPYIYLCKEGAVIEASFMNMILGFNADATSRKKGGVNKDGKGCYAILEIRNGDSLAGGFMRSITINGTVATDKPYAPDVTWTFTSLGVTKNEPDIPEEPDDDDGDDYFDDPGVWDDGEDIYTVTELKYAIEEKEKEIKELELDIKDAQISISKAQRDMDNATVKATINGVVKEVGDPSVGQIEGEPFMTLTSNKGMYVKGTISEMDLGTITVGSVVSGTAQESGMSITAEITEISEYPTGSGGYYYGEEINPNASSYPFIAYVDDSEDLINHEWVVLEIEGNVQTGNSIYLAKALVRSENGQSYVYIEGDNKRLVKQYVRTGKTVYSTYIEVKEGLTEEDWIAFPYGKNVREGAPVNELEGSGFADQMYY